VVVVVVVDDVAVDGGAAVVDVTIELVVPGAKLVEDVLDDGPGPTELLVAVVVIAGGAVVLGASASPPPQAPAMRESISRRETRLRICASHLWSCSTSQ
jgi:hypothetical protein